jgi:hypothetical protein
MADKNIQESRKDLSGKAAAKRSSIPKICYAIVAVFVLIAGCAGGCEMLNRTVYIKGSRVGFIFKFAQCGLFWKTYQGEVNMGGTQSSLGSSAPNIWYFSLDNQRRRGENIDSLAKAINGYLGAGQAVKITYYAPFFSWPWRSYGRYLVQNVEPISGK